jgi:hypothetical protein
LHERLPKTVATVVGLHVNFFDSRDSTVGEECDMIKPEKIADQHGVDLGNQYQR